MLARLSLRLRIFLFFALLGLGAVAIIEGSLYLAALRAESAGAAGVLVTGGILAAFLTLGLVTGIWWLFDVNVARAVERLSSDLRTRAHGGVARGIDPEPARYLGDLAPAADALTRSLAEIRQERDRRLAERTQALQDQADQLSALLSDVQTGLLVCAPGHRLVFYNAPAVELLKDTGRPRLDRSVFDLLRERPIRRTYDRLLAEGEPGAGAELLVSTVACGRAIAAHMRLVSGALGLGETPGYVLTLRDVSADMKLHTERERLLRETVDALRRPAAALRALLDVRPDHPGGGIDTALLQEAAALVEEVGAIAARHDAHQDTWWPMQDVRAAHLIDALRGQLGPDGPAIDAPTPYMRLHCDAHAVVGLLAGLIDRAHADGLAASFAIHVQPDAPGALIRLSWQGAPMRIAALQALLEEPVRDVPFALTGREILDHHNTDIWPETGADGRAALVMPIREAERVDPSRKPARWTAERPAVFDFDLLNQVRDGAKTGKPLSQLTYVVFDTETTGLDPNGGDEIVQIAAVRLLNGRRVTGEVLNELVDPGRPIPPVATKVHGISDDMVAGAPSIAEVGARFHRFCENAVLVAHNAAFDMAFLHRHADEIGAHFDHPVFDTVLLSAVLFGSAESHTLDALADRFGVVIPERDRHTALGDTLATAEVFQKMLPMLQAQGFATFDDVMAEMRRNSRLMREMKARVG